MITGDPNNSSLPTMIMSMMITMMMIITYILPSPGGLIHEYNAYMTAIFYNLVMLLLGGK